MTCGKYLEERIPKNKQWCSKECEEKNPSPSINDLFGGIFNQGKQ